jgi:hypothetical protein
MDKAGDKEFSIGESDRKLSVFTKCLAWRDERATILHLSFGSDKIGRTDESYRKRRKLRG